MWVWWVMAMAGDEAPAVEDPPAEVPQPAPAAPAPPPAMDPSMRGHFEKATTAMLAVALGQVSVAKEAAGALADAPGVPPVLHDAAQALEKCGRLECATERVSDMARTCAECHLDTGHGPRPRNLTTLPGATARERHIYAATFAWVGLVTPKQPLFLFGLANVVPPVEKTGGTKQLVEARDAFRAAQQASVSAETLEDRSAAFADLLAACAGCHEVSGVPAK
jgi:cytochrome c553